MPTGVHLHDVRGQLFDAAERVLLRDGAPGLTSRAVTAEAGCAKGVLYRHFADFDAFLADLVLDRTADLASHAAALRAAAGRGSVEDNVTQLLISLYRPVAVAMIPLITFRDELRARLRQGAPGGGVAILSEATSAIAGYLADERDLGRIVADADLEALTLALVGGGHLLFTDRDRDRPSVAEVSRFVTAAIASALARPRL